MLLKVRPLGETAGPEVPLWVSLSRLRAVGQPDLLPSPSTSGYHDNALFSPGPVVSSESSFTFFFCFSPSSLASPAPHPPPSHMLRSLVKRSKSKVGQHCPKAELGAVGGTTEGKGQRAEGKGQRAPVFQRRGVELRSAEGREH